MSNAKQRDAHNEQVPWSGPRTVVVPRTANGFGFTLRHFIVYPPVIETPTSGQREIESVDAASICVNDKRQQLEAPPAGACDSDSPMETIFVKDVKDGGPASLAGLKVGDRVIMVNNEDIVAKSYAQVVALIKTSDSSLKLLVVPKDEDILQMAYESSLQQHEQPAVVETLPQTELSQSPDLLRHIPPTAIPASRLISSDQLPRRASARNPTCSSGATPTISCPYYKSELYIVSEEQAFRSQRGRPFRSDDVADCVAVASSTPPSVTVPHRSFLRSPDVIVGGRSDEHGQHSEFVMRHSYCGSASPSSTSGIVTSSVPVTASASHLSSVQDNWPASTSRRSLTESKWKWLHSNAAMPEQSSPISLRRATRLDIPSTSPRAASPLCKDLRQQSAGSLTIPISHVTDGRLADAQDQAHAPRLYYSKPVVDYSATVGEQPQRRKTKVDLVQSVTDVHRSVDDKYVRHWRHSSDNTSRRSTTDPTSRKWDSYGLTLSLSGAAVPQSLGSDVKKLNIHRSTNGHAAPAANGDLPQKLPVERIMRFERSDVLDSIGYPPSSAWHPKDIATSLSSRRVSEDIALRTTRYETHTESDSTKRASPPLAAKSGQSGRLSIPDSIPIYFRAEPSVGQSQPSSSLLETKAGRGESKTVPYLTDDHRQLSSITSNQSTGCASDSVNASSDTAEKSFSASGFLSTAHVNMQESPTDEADRESKLQRRTSYLMATGRQHHLDGSCLSSLVSSSLAATPAVSSASSVIHTAPNPTAITSAKASSIKKLKALFGEKTSKAVDSVSTDRRCQFELPATGTGDCATEGVLSCKVAAADGKRTSDRSWKSMWAVLKDETLFLYREKTSTFTDDQLQQPIFIKGSTVDIAYDYTKKKNVFRLTTPAGSEYLFQAEDRPAMLTWIKTIQPACLPDGSIGSSASLDVEVHGETTSAVQEVKVSPTVIKSKKATSLTAKLKSPAPVGRAKKFSLDKSPTEKVTEPVESPKSKDKVTWKGRMVRHFRRHGSASSPSYAAAKTSEVTGTFGVPLELCVSSSFCPYVPLVVEVCIQIVEEKGLDNQGIYRVPGNSGAVSQLQEELNKDPECLDMDNERWQDVNVVSSLLKLFLRKLPDPLITDELYESVIAANHVEDQTKRMLKIKKLLHELPEHNFETFHFIAQHLNLVASHELTNKMDPRNLAIVFGPTLIRPLDDSIITMVRDMSDQCRITEMIIHHCQWFFGAWDEDVTVPFVASSNVEAAPVTGVNNEMLLKAELMASGDRSRDSSAKEIVSSIFHAANKRIRRSRDKSSGRMRESGEQDGSASEPTSYSERNIDHEVELHRLQELLRTGGTSDQAEDTNKQTLAADSHNSSVSFSTSSAETKDLPVGHSSKTADSPTRRECLGSASLKERRACFIQYGCTQLPQENSEHKRRSVDVSQLTDTTTFKETVGSTAVTCTASVSSLSRPGDVTITVPSSGSLKMQHAAEQRMQQLADDLQRTFNTTTTLSPPNISPVASELSLQYQQETAAVSPRAPSASDTTEKSAADSQSVTSDYSTMSSVCGGRDSDCRRNRLASGALDITAAPGFDTRKIADMSAVGRRRHRNEVQHSTPRSQSSGSFSLANSDAAAEASLYTASAMELSRDSIDSAADHSDQLSLSMSSQMSGSQISDSDDLLRTVGAADKLSFSPLVQLSGTADQKSCPMDSSCVHSADTQFEQFGETSVAGLTLQSDVRANNSVGLTVQHDLNTIKTGSETGIVLDRPRCAVDSMSSEKRDVSRNHDGNGTAEILSVDAELAAHVQITPFEQNTDCSNCTDGSKVVPSTDGDNKRMSVYSAKEQFVPSQHPVSRLVRRHTLGGTGDLVFHAIDPKFESSVNVQSSPSQDEERLSAWQRLKPAVKDPVPNFGTWLATQRQLHHVRSSPALFVGVALTPASCLYSSQLNCQSVV